MKVECPRCKTQVDALAGMDLSCPTCGFSAPVPADAVATPAAPAPTPPAPVAGAWTSTGGAVVHEPTQPPSQGMAIAAIVLAVLGFLSAIFVIGILLDIVAVVLGIVVLVQHSKKPNDVGGKGLAIAAIVVAAVSLLLMVLLYTVGVAAAVSYCEDNPDVEGCSDILANSVRDEPRPVSDPLARLAAMVPPVVRWG